VRVMYDNINFMSKKERDRYIVLKDREKHGLIKDLKLQVHYEITPSYELNGKKIQKSEYIADFVYMQKLDGDIPMWKEVVEDVKGYKTQEYKLKKKWIGYRYHVEIKEIY